MPTTYADLLSSAKKRVKEVSLDELKRRLEAKEPITVVDVREKEEFRTGYIPGAVSLPRGFLEIQAEQRLPDKNARIVAGVSILNQGGVQEQDGDGYFIREGIVIVPKNGVIKDGTVI